MQIGDRVKTVSSPFDSIPIGAKGVIVAKHPMFDMFEVVSTAAPSRSPAMVCLLIGGPLLLVNWK